MEKIRFDIKSGFIRLWSHENLKYVFMLSVLATITFFIKNVLYIKSSMLFDAYVMPMTISLGMIKYLFVFFLFMAFEYIYMLKASLLEEAVESMYHGIRRYERGSLLVCILLAAFYWLLFVVLNVGACAYIGFFDWKYYFYIFGVLFFYVFNILLLAILLAWMVAKRFGRIVSYSILICIIFFSSVFFEEITALLYDMGINIYPFQELFSFLPTGMDFMPNFQNPFVVQIYRIALLYMWIFGVTAIACFHKHPIQKTFYGSLAFVVLTLVSLVLYIVPSPKILMNENPKGTLYEGQVFYADNEIVFKESGDDFQVNSYIMNMKIGRQLENTVDINVEPHDLQCYCFTLFHGYSVDSVKDQDGNKLPYLQEQDYLYIYKDKDDVKTLSIHYQGSSSTYYACSQGVFLPGNFPYYPQPGLKKVFDPDNYTYAGDFLKEKAYFEVKIQGGHQIYTNLECDDTGWYKGYCQGPIFANGFLEQYEQQGISLVYPYLNSDYSVADIQTWIRSLQDELKGAYPDKIFVAPNLNQKNTIYISDDYTITPYLFDAIEYETEK